MNEYFKQSTTESCQLYYIDDYEQFKSNFSQYIIQSKFKQSNNMYKSDIPECEPDNYYPSRIITSKNNMNGNLWLGAVNYISKKFLIENNITHLLNVTKDEVFICDKVSLKRIAIHDSISEDILQHFEDAYNFIDEALNEGNCIVYCHAGISRSPTIVCAYLMRKYRMSNKTALDHVQKIRNVVCPNIRFIAALDNYHFKMQQEAKTTPTATINETCSNAAITNSVATTTTTTKINNCQNRMIYALFTVTCVATCCLNLLSYE